MKSLIVAGNWKMYKTRTEVTAFFNELTARLENQKLGEVTPLICPPYIYLSECASIAGQSNLKVAAQDVSMHQFGAYTGEISAPMLRSIDIGYCLIGHSERRKYHDETDDRVRVKLLKLLENDLIPIICLGEKEEERENGMTTRIITRQLESIFKDITINEPQRFIIAYEPVWAIGTGKTATPEIAQEVHSLIRGWLKSNYTQEIAEQLPILYGGSIKPDNFHELLKQPDIDGGLIGGASLKIDDYWSLLKTAIPIAEKLQK